MFLTPLLYVKVQKTTTVYLQKTLNYIHINWDCYWNVHWSLFVEPTHTTYILVEKVCLPWNEFYDLLCENRVLTTPQWVRQDVGVFSVEVLVKRPDDHS